MTEGSENGRKGRGRKTMPLILVAAEVLLAIVLFRYFFIITYCVCPTGYEWIELVPSFVSLTYSAAMSVLTVDAMFGIVSSKPVAWRKVVRSAMMLFITNLVYDVFMAMGAYTMGMFASRLYIDDLTSLAIMIVILAIMFLPSVRKYYTPIMLDAPHLRDWILFVFGKKLFRVEAYKLIYATDDSGQMDEEA